MDGDVINIAVHRYLFMRMTELNANHRRSMAEARYVNAVLYRFLRCVMKPYHPKPTESAILWFVDEHDLKWSLRPIIANRQHQIQTTALGTDHGSIQT